VCGEEDWWHAALSRVVNGFGVCFDTVVLKNKDIGVLRERYKTGLSQVWSTSMEEEQGRLAVMEQKAATSHGRR
jgi:hypothetical protein